MCLEEGTENGAWGLPGTRIPQAPFVAVGSGTVLEPQYQSKKLQKPAEFLVFYTHRFISSLSVIFCKTHDSG